MYTIFSAYPTDKISTGKRMWEDNIKLHRSEIYRDDFMGLK